MGAGLEQRGGPGGDSGVTLGNEWQMVGWTAEWVFVEDSELAWDVSATR